MRRVTKQQAPACLTNFIEAQQGIQPEPVNLNYRNFPRKPELRAVLTAEQFGLCGYTGSPVDEDRLSGLKAPTGVEAFANHIEHLKSQRICRQELEAAGGVFGRDLGQDLDYANLIAALEVRGARQELFGAVAKKDRALPLSPVDVDCEQRFRYRDDGVVEGLHDDSRALVELLLLNHETLKGWRKQAIQVWLDPAVIQSADDVHEVLVAVSTPRDGTLPEFAFAIEAVARSLLDEADV